MALKAGRVGVAPSQVDEFGIIQGGGPSGDAYTKAQTDAKFLAKTDAADTYESKTHADNTYATKAMVNALAADDIAYDGTDSGLTATDTQAAIDEVNDKVDTFHNYSNSEQVIGKWIDDKPIYRKVISGTTSSTSGEWVDIALIEDLDNVINMYGFCTQSVDGVRVPCNYYRYQETLTNTVYCSTVVGGDNKLKILSKLTDMEVVVVIEYTKTTD